METILVATDGSGPANKAVSLAIDLAKKFGAKLVIVHANEGHELSPEERRLASVEYAEEIGRQFVNKRIQTPDISTDIPLPTVLAHNWDSDSIIRNVLGRGLLDRTREDALVSGLKNVETVLVNGDAVKGILDTARECGADMIVLGSRGRSELQELFLGSVAHKVNHLSDTTVVTVK